MAHTHTHAHTHTPTHTHTLVYSWQATTTGIDGDTAMEATNPVVVSNEADGEWGLVWRATVAPGQWDLFYQASVMIVFFGGMGLTRYNCEIDGDIAVLKRNCFYSCVCQPPHHHALMTVLTLVETGNRCIWRPPWDSRASYEWRRSRRPCC